MKILSYVAIAAMATTGLSTAALAQHTTSETIYSSPLLQLQNSLPSHSIFGVPITGPAAAQNSWNYAQTHSAGLKAVSGSRFHDEGTAPDNTENAERRVVNSFTLKGSVDKDCSFYGGGTTSHTIDLGTIGVRTGDNDNVSIAFNQNGDITANVNSATAGCNTNNTVTVSKANGGKGLMNNSSSGYDTDQFTNHIPYTIDVSYTGVGQGATHHGNTRTLKVGLHQDQNSKSNGAWRSQFNMDIDAPAQSKGLLAGNYKDTITVELKAI